MTWARLGTELDDVTRYRMAVAEVGGDPMAVSYPDAQQTARGAKVVVDYARLTLEVVWAAAEVASTKAEDEGDWLCWACLPKPRPEVEQVLAARELCEATHRCTRDCGRTR